MQVGKFFTWCATHKTASIRKKYQFPELQRADAASDVAREIYDRLMWCNISSSQPLTIASEVQFLVAYFSKLDQWLKEMRCAKSFLQKETEFFSNVNKLFDVICCNGDQRKHLQKNHTLQMIEKNCVFYEAQR